MEPSGGSSNALPRAAGMARPIHRRASTTGLQPAITDPAPPHTAAGTSIATPLGAAASPPTRRRRPLVNAAQLATYLGDTERHIRKLVFERRIPVIRVGGKVRFNLDTIDLWLDEHTEEPTPLPRPAARPW